jgi:hypothetical protein
MDLFFFLYLGLLIKNLFIMKKLILFGVLGFMLFSCSDDVGVVEEKKGLVEFSERDSDNYALVEDTQTGDSLFVFFDSDENNPVDLSKPKTYLDASRVRPVVVAYWQCGPGVYTNGSSTYTINIVGCETSGSYMLLDHFSQSVYCVTTSWGGSCGGW